MCLHHAQDVLWVAVMIWEVFHGHQNLRVCACGHTLFITMETGALLNPTTLIGEPLSGASPLQPLWNESISRGLGGVTRPGLELRLGITSPFIDSTLNAKCVQFESFYSITLTLGPASLPLNHE